MLGPLLWGPLSEIFGRRPIFIITFIAYIGFQVGCALSKNTASILVFRFLGGTFAAAPLTNSGALIADIWDGDHRGKAMCKSSLPFLDPFSPIASSSVNKALYVTLIEKQPSSLSPLLPDRPSDRS
jgi:MFS family permease